MRWRFRWEERSNGGFRVKMESGIDRLVCYDVSIVCIMGVALCFHFENTILRSAFVGMVRDKVHNLRRV